MKKSTLYLGLALATISFAFVGCKDDEPKEDQAQTLYAKLGGSAKVDDPNNPGTQIETGYLGLRSVVDSSIFVIAGDARLQPFFGPLLGEVGNGDLSGFAVLSKNLTDFFASASGAANVTYTGLDMVAAHNPDQNPRMVGFATDASFDAFIEDVGAGATQVGVSAELIGEVAALIETLRGQVVQTPTQSLYDKLGGSTLTDDPNNPGTQIETGYLGLRSVVDSSIFVIAADSRLQPFFSTLLAEVGNGDLSGFAVLSKNLTDFFATATGSKNITYSGLDMVAAHDPAINTRMEIKADNASFDAFIQDVGTGATQVGVSSELIGEVAALIETLRSQVVQN